MLRKGYEAIEDVRKTPGARHPLVRTEPGTGRRCLFLGRRPRSWIVGLTVAALLLATRYRRIVRAIAQ